jgi:hypothetical protein
MANELERVTLEQQVWLAIGYLDVLPGEGAKSIAEGLRANVSALRTEPAANDKARFREAALGMVRAIRREDEDPYPDEPYISMDDAAEVHAQLVASEPAVDAVERVARAITQPIMHEFDGWDTTKPVMFKQVSAKDQATLLAIARAAIAALSPTPVPDVAGLLKEIREQRDWMGRHDYAEQDPFQESQELLDRAAAALTSLSQVRKESEQVDVNDMGALVNRCFADIGDAEPFVVERKDEFLGARIGTTKGACTQLSAWLLANRGHPSLAYFKAQVRKDALEEVIRNHRAWMKGRKGREAECLESLLGTLELMAKAARAGEG